ncbi:DUF2207 domain-containing protein [Slackia heliotrinireducens]|uniref:DUF2207 domain-containing protein n=1 Tax=Slackia heliotrinireducens TaxID=84110 RepID=UPI00331491D2
MRRNTSYTHLPKGRSLGRPQVFSKSLLVLAVVMAAVLALFMFMRPAEAYAKEYTCPQTVMNADVSDDGTLTVQENRTFDFDGSFTAIWWVFERLGYDAQIVIDNAVVTNDATGESLDLDEVPFQEHWREYGASDEPAWTWDAEQNTVYVFCPMADGTYTITLEWHAENMATLYADTGEVYWQFVGGDWAIDSYDVTLNLQLPVPDGETVTAGENVRVWGHGPLDATVHVDETGLVTADVPVVPSGEFAEVRATIPTEWLSGVAPGAYNDQSGTEKMDEILAEEQEWADKANTQRIMAVSHMAMGILASIGLIIWSIVMFFRHGREYRLPKDKYWRDLPAPGVHPAVISRLWSWNREDNNDFVATLMHLCNIGAIRIDPGTYQRKRKTVSDYYITRLDGWQDKVNNSPIDKEAMRILFDKVGRGADSIWFGNIEVYGKQHPESLVRMMDRWQEIVTSQTDQRGYFEDNGELYCYTMRIFAALCVIIGVFCSIMFMELIELIALSIAAVVLLVISFFMPRRSWVAAEIYGRCEGLRNWLKDFSLLNERLPTDVKVWGAFMVYAYVFGVAKRAMEQLQVSLPNVVSDAGFVSTSTWMGYRNGYVVGPNAAPVSPLDMFSTMYSNTVRTAKATIAAAETGNFIGDVMSSGGGGGGGFSGGGGGGFGGGGGGAR